jgi:hypothetical protein
MRDRGILPQKFLDLSKTPRLDPRRCFAMADNIGGEEVVERVSLTVVPRVEETADDGLVPLYRRAHREGSLPVIGSDTLAIGAL